MSRVTLIRPAYSDVYGLVYQADKSFRRQILPPLALMSLAGYLKQHGHDAIIIDGEPDLLTAEQTVEQALATSPAVVGITATTPEFPLVFEIVKAIKQRRPDVVTVVGGAHITSLPGHTMADLAPYADWGVVWEGEKPIQAIADGDPLSCAWPEGPHPQLLKSPSRLDALELDAFFPDRSTLDMTRYQMVDTGLGLTQCDAIQTARGCPFGCSFCTSRRTALTNRTIASVMREIHDTVTRHGTKSIVFFDDTLNIERNRVMELFQAVVAAKRRHEIPEDVCFYALTRASALDLDLLRVMQDAGADRLTMGVETGNHEIMRRMMKGCTLDHYREAYAMLDQVGILKRGSFIVGHPYETEETIGESIRFALELDLDEFAVNIMTPYPGQVEFRAAFDGKGIWLSHPMHYKELRGDGQDWHAYWGMHRRWGKSIVETETLSAPALEYWHKYFLQEIYGSARMAVRRERHVAAGNTDTFWHRPWRTHSEGYRKRVQEEAEHGRPSFPAPVHTTLTYEPVRLEDFQKSEYDRQAMGLRKLAATAT
ncbi:MAG: radical SAM protein [Acidobacteriota bacterium]